MRLRVTEVNVEQLATVPQRGLLARLYLWACERLYAELAWQYDLVSWIVSAGQWRRWQAGVWAEVRGHDLVEIGCGTGAMLLEGERRGFRMVGIDRSPRMLAVARARLHNRGGHAPLILGDGRSLPFVDGACDSVMATFPAGYILDVATLKEAHRALRADGRLVILGLWVALEIKGIEDMLPIFYGRPRQAALDAIAERVAAVGFGVRWVEQRTGPFAVGVLVAERE